MAKKSVDQIYSTLESMSEDLDKLVKDADSLVASVRDYGGILSKIFDEQFHKYFIPALKSINTDVETAGSIAGVKRFLDSVTLAMIRTDDSDSEPQEAEANVDLPSSEEAQNFTPDETQAPQEQMDSIPRNMSYTTQQGEPVKPVEAPQEVVPRAQESYDKFQVVRKSGIGSSLGEIARLKSHPVAEFNTKEEAEMRANELNKSIRPEEKDFLHTEYEVVQRTFGK